MTELSFTKPWVNYTSPVVIRLGDEPFTGVTLRFDKPWVNYTSPIVIRFNGDTPPPVIVDNSFGIECGVIWVLPTEPQSDCVLLEYVHGLGVDVYADYSTNVGDGVVISSDWQSWYSHGVIAAMGWFINDETRSDISFNWVTPVDHISITRISWVTPDDHQTDTTMQWLDIGSHGISNSVNWWDGFKNQSDTLVSYHGGVRDSQYSVKWGEHKARWVCSSNYRPPKVGIITLRFNTNYADKQSPVTLRFVASPEYCYWDDGGGTINPFPDLPPIDFKIPIEPQIKRVYLMQPTLIVTRVSDGLRIIVTDVSITDQRGQHSKSVSINFSSRIDSVRALNELLHIEINGYDFYCVIEQVNRKASFGVDDYTGSGRSKTALINTPWVGTPSYTNSTSLSIAGMLNQLLLNTGWTVDLHEDIVDFVVPSGAFSIIGKSPIEAVSDAVSQMGCMIVADDSTNTLLIVPQWPVTPWLMQSAISDVNIHDAVIMSYDESLSVGTLCNGVWLRGEQQGVSAFVKRTGTDGALVTNDISNQLIVDVQAARIAGTTALGDTGDKVNITVELPVMNDLPPLTKGMLVGVTFRTEVFKTTCDGVSIRASVGNDGVNVTQVVGLIRHIE